VDELIDFMLSEVFKDEPYYFVHNEGADITGLASQFDADTTFEEYIAEKHIHLAARVKSDKSNEEIEVSFIEDETERENTPTAGYYAMFEYTNGFRKAIYWSREKMEAHAEKYSQGYRAHKGFTFWEKDFDGMAYKTMLRQLISKWGIMSIEMRDVITKDDCILRENNAIELVADTNDNDAVDQQNEPTKAEKVTMDKL